MSEMIYGIHAVQALLERAPERFQEVFILKGREDKRLLPLIHALESQGVVIQLANRQYLDEKSDGAVHQGIIARVKPGRQYQENDLPDLIASLDQPFLLILDGVTDPHNLGAIIRTAECVGAHGVIIPKRRSAGLTAVVDKASAGALEHMAVARVPNLVAAIETLKKNGLWIYGTAAEGSNELWKTDLTGPACIVIGSEGAGISRLVREKCDFLVSIPLRGQISSLNASAAAAVLLYEALRQRS